MGICMLAGVLSTLDQASYFAKRHNVGWVEAWNALHPYLTVVTMPKDRVP